MSLRSIRKSRVSVNYDESIYEKPCVRFQPMTKAELRSLPPDFEEIRVIGFPEFHLDGFVWVKIHNSNSEYFLKLYDAAMKLKEDLMNLINQNRTTHHMTDRLWRYIKKTLYGPVRGTLPIGSYCFNKNENMSTHLRYLIINNYKNRNNILCYLQPRTPVYSVHNVDPRAHSKTLLNKKDDEELKKDEGLLCEKDMILITPPTIWNETDYGWETVKLHYNKINSRSLFCMGRKIYGSLNMPSYRRNYEIKHQDKMSENVSNKAGHGILSNISNKIVETESNICYIDINYDSLAALIGIDLLQKTVETNRFYILCINMEWNKNNLMLTLTYWTAYDDSNKVPHTKAHACLRI